jgi:hypothetical protein
MPELNFQVIGVEAVAHSLTPLLHFKLRITNSPTDQVIQAVLLTTQIQIQPAQRTYTPAEKEKLYELFGPPEVWGQTLRNRLWTHASATISSFTESTYAVLPVSCTADLNVAATKYFHALNGGEISLLFLFSGSVFYTEGGRLQVSPISWNQESAYRITAATWQALMERHYPNTGWLTLRRDTLDRLYAHKRRFGLMTWEETFEHLLAAAGEGHEGSLTGVESVPHSP